MKRTIVDYLSDQTRRAPDRPAIYYRHETVSFRDLEEQSARCRGALSSLGLEPGDCVALVMRDCPEMTIAMLGVMSIGAIVVPCNTTLKPAEIEYVLEDSGARLVIVTPEYVENVKAAKAKKILVAPDEFNRILQSSAPKPPADFNGYTPCLILYTSGSTGSPKGAVHLHSHLPHTVERVARAVYDLQPDDRIFSSSKLFFAYGLGNSFSFPLGTGCSSVLCPERTTPAVIADIFKQYRPTVFFGVPAIFRGLIEHARQGNHLETESLKFCVSGGEILTAATWKDWKQVTGCEIIEAIGTTELLHAFIHNFRDRNRPGSSGVPLEGYEVKLTDDAGNRIEGAARGNLHVKGGSAIPYYLNKPDITAELIRDGWIKTGDVYRRDEEGFYWFEGRSDDIFKCSGMWVSPSDVEAAVIKHPAVLEAAVVAEVDDKGSTIAAAYVALRTGYSPGDDLSKEIMEETAKTLPRYKCPRRVHFVEVLPRTSTGKLQRFKLRALSSP